METATKPSLRRITGQVLERWLELNERRERLTKEARQFDAEMKLIEEEVQAAMEAEEKGRIVRGQGVAELDEVANTVKWKEAYTRAHGAEAVAKLVLEAGKKKQLTIKRLA